MTIQDLRIYLQKQENAPNFDGLLNRIDDLEKLCKDLAETNSHELPYRGERLIEEANSLCLRFFGPELQKALKL